MAEPVVTTNVADAPVNARRIGPVAVDRDETGCQTPEIIPDIERALAHREAQAAKRRARATASAR